MKSLVTGGAGFIGSHVASHLLGAGHDVVVLDDLSGGFKDIVPERARFVEGSVTDHSLVDRLFSEHGFDYVFHLAAYAAEGLSHFIRRFNYENNLAGSVNLVNASVNTGTVKRFVFTSSIAVYGAGQTPMSEAMTPEPEDPYGISKYAFEMDLRAARRIFGLEYTVFRPHNVYGEHQNIGDRYRNVVGIFMNQIMAGEPLTVFGDGMQTRAFSHVDDVAPVIARSVGVPEAANEVFNIGADKPYSVLELAQEVTRAFDAKSVIRHLPARNEVIHAFSTHERVARVFGPSEDVSLAEGVRRMAVWARRHGARQGQVFNRVEVVKNMPASWRRDLLGSKEDGG